MNKVKTIYWTKEKKVSSSPNNIINQIPVAITNQDSLIPFDINNEPDENSTKFAKMTYYLLSRYDIRYNIVANDYEFKSKGDQQYKILNENDLIVELLEAGFKAVENYLSYLLKSNYTPKFNPIFDYLEQLPDWTPNQPDYIEQLANYVKVKDQRWFNDQFKKMLVRSLACVTNIIPFNKQCFTLVGRQNDGKSSFLRFLCPTALKDYFKENLEFDSKDGKIALAHNLFINLDELACFTKVEINKAKSFFTLDKVKERIPYDKKPSTFPRIANFLASTNDNDFLTDVTGNVRWIIFETMNIQHDNGGSNGYNANVDIDLVYSQAKYLLQTGFKFQLNKAEIEKSEQINRFFQKSSPAIDLINKYFRPGTESDHTAFLNATEINEQLKMVAHYVRLNNNNIGKALRFLKFKRCQKYTKDKTQIKGYYLKFEKSDARLIPYNSSSS